jgi:hypothetical protein
MKFRFAKGNLLQTLWQSICQSGDGLERIFAETRRWVIQKTVNRAQGQVETLI